VEAELARHNRVADARADALERRLAQARCSWSGGGPWAAGDAEPEGRGRLPFRQLTAPLIVLPPFPPSFTPPQVLRESAGRAARQQQQNAQLLSEVAELSVGARAAARALAAANARVSELRRAAEEGGGSGGCHVGAHGGVSKRARAVSPRAGLPVRGGARGAGDDLAVTAGIASAPQPGARRPRPGSPPPGAPGAAGRLAPAAAARAAAAQAARAAELEDALARAMAAAAGQAARAERLEAQLAAARRATAEEAHEQEHEWEERGRLARGECAAAAAEQAAAAAAAAVARGARPGSAGAAAAGAPGAAPPRRPASGCAADSAARPPRPLRAQAAPWPG
jgi:colicin import membrane protein